MLDDLIGLGAGLVIGDTVRKKVTKTGHRVVGSREGDCEATDLLMDGVGLVAGVVVGDAIFDMFSEDNDSGIFGMFGDD